MSILIKSDELNYLIYKYLQQAGLNHTAFSFYNEAALQPIMIEFKYNTQAGQLISLLQKGLILTQIESHIVLDDFHDCKVPFSLIRPHHCKIVEKVIELKQKIQQEHNKQIADSIQRTIDAIKVIPNPQPCKPDTEGKQRNYLQQLLKLKFKCDPDDICYCPSTETLSVNEKQQNKITFLKFNQEIQNFEVTGIIPAYFGNSFKPVTIHSHNSKYILVVFEGNSILLIETKTHSILKMFNVKNIESSVQRIHWHPKEENFVALEFQNQIRVFNLQQLAVITTLYGKLFEWRYADEFIYFNSTQIQHRTLSGNVLNSFNSQDPINALKLSKDKQFILSICFSTNTIRMYTFLSEDPLFVFQQRQPIKTAKFAVSKNATYILILLQNGLKIWDVELSQLKQQLAEEEKFSNISVINYNDKAYNILLAEGTIILHDISSNRKATRGLYQLEEEEEKNFQLKELNDEESILIGSSNIYIISKRMIEPTF